jgi:hypothetical protein
MVKIANFESVLEIAFGLNALFYILELVPRTKERMRELMVKHDEAYKAKVEATGSSEVFPIGFLISAKYGYKMWVMEKITVAMSLTILGFLIYSAFVPDAEMSSRKMVALLCFSFGIPCLAIRLCNRPFRWIEASIRLLEKETTEARHAKSEAAIEALKKDPQKGTSDRDSSEPDVGDGTP